MRTACTWAALLAAATSSFAADSRTPPYAGPEVCAKCHKEIAAAQRATAMANTWDAASTLPLPPGFQQKKVEGPDPALIYEMRSSGGNLKFSLTEPNGSKLVLPVEDVIGGQRHGVSFLVRMRTLDGIPLARPALIETRYAYSPHGSLVLSPGFQTEKPTSLEHALGRVLSPAFEQRCLTCHGQPGTLGAGAHGGVRCESCHGPAAAHVQSITAGAAQPIRPETLAGSKVIAVCAQCHTGLSNINQADPVPGDLLVSSQVPALQHSECFRQTAGALTCTDCHNPHSDAADVAARATNNCLRCHSAANPAHASICPVNASSGCPGCHMPSTPVNGFQVADHWIAVHPAQNLAPANTPAANLRSLVTPKREYLEMIATPDRAKAEAALQRLTAGELFYDVARETSMESTASAGGYVGDVELSDMDPRLASVAARLWYGETSAIIQQENRYLVLHRLPRDFKSQANQLFLEAIRLHTLGDRKAALAKAQAALKIYPYFLRAHIFMGTQIAQTGDAARAAYALAFAAQSYPTDAFAQFQYALALGKQPAAQEAFRRAIQLEPDIVPAYENLAAALLAEGDIPGAIKVFRQGLAVNPLSADLNNYLAAVLKEQGDEAGAKQCSALAARLASQ